MELTVSSWIQLTCRMAYSYCYSLRDIVPSSESPALTLGFARAQIIISATAVAPSNCLLVMKEHSAPSHLHYCRLLHSSPRRRASLVLSQSLWRQTSGTRLIILFYLTACALFLCAHEMGLCGYFWESQKVMSEERCSYDATISASQARDSLPGPTAD